MIAKYAGKCDLTGTAIIAGQTEIAKFGNATVLAEYATQEAMDSWFASQAAEFETVATQIAAITGNSEYVSNAVSRFTGDLERRRNDRFFVLKPVAEWVRSEIAQLGRILDRKRQQA